MAQSLVLDHLDPDPTVARRLSPSLAFRHRALPVAPGVCAAKPSGSYSHVHETEKTSGDWKRVRELCCHAQELLAGTLDGSAASTACAAVCTRAFLT
jgi:hypothetical protein